MAGATAVKKASPTGPTQVLSEWEDLARAGYTKSAFRDKYREIYSAEPDCVSVNEGVCMEYGHYCYTIRDGCTYSNKQLSTIMATGDSKEFVNSTDEPSTLHIELKSTHKMYAIATVTQPSTFSFRSKIPVRTSELGIQNAFSTGFSLNNHTGSTCCTSEDIEITESVSLILQPGQRAMATLDLSWTEMRENFTIPFRIDGWCMATFSDLVNGHRYWLHDIASLFETPKSCLSGTVECVYDIKSSAHVQFL